MQSGVVGDGIRIVVDDVQTGVADVASMSVATEFDFANRMPDHTPAPDPHPDPRREATGIEPPAPA